MALRANYPIVGEIEHPGLAEALRRRLATAQDAAVMLSLGVGVCLSWPQVPRSIVLAMKVVFFYLFSPR